MPRVFLWVGQVLGVSDNIHGRKSDKYQCLLPQVH